MNDSELEKIDFKVVWKKNTYDVSFPLDHQIDQLKEHINTLCGEHYLERNFTANKCINCFLGIPPAMMKLMYKGELFLALLYASIASTI